MDLPAIVTWAYFSIYCFLLLMASIWSAIIVKEEYKMDQQQQSVNDPQTAAPTENTDNIPSELQEKEHQKKHGFTHYFKKWMRLTWNKKKIYLSLLPHLADQATDAGVIAQYYAHLDDDKINENINVIYWFYLSIIILVLHRIISAFGIHLITKSWLNVFLQLLDVLMIRAVWTSYKLNRDEPSTAQRWLGLMEATFEAMPQLLLSAVWMTKTGEFDVIIVISFVSSLISLTSRVSGDDKLIFKDEWKSLDATCKSCPCVNPRYVLRVFLRFMEISSKLALLTLMWINLGGLATGIIIGAEFIFLVIICIGFKSIGNMGNLMYLVRDDGDSTDASEWADLCWVIFTVYRLLSAYIYLILMTCFGNIQFESLKVDDYEKRHSYTMQPNSIGFYLFVWCWMAYCIYPCCSYWMIKHERAVRQDLYEATTGRDFKSLRDNHDYVGMLELVELGQKITDHELLYLKVGVEYAKDDGETEMMKQLQAVIDKH